VREQRVARDVEWDAETEIRGTLEHEAAQAWACPDRRVRRREVHVELSEQVAWGKCHLRNVWQNVRLREQVDAHTNTDLQGSTR
jgi:hypothetical protein